MITKFPGSETQVVGATAFCSCPSLPVSIRSNLVGLLIKENGN
jgi:hypothetical protein